MQRRRFDGIWRRRFEGMLRRRFDGTLRRPSEGTLRRRFDGMLRRRSEGTLLRRRFDGMLRLPSRRETIRALGAAASIALICWYFGVDAWHSILLGCGITVAVLAGITALESPEAGDLSWRPGKRPASTGSRNDVANLSSSLHAGGWGLVGLTAERRLRQIALKRLALEGLDLRNDDHRAEIEHLIGRHAYRMLAPGRRRPMRLRTIVDCLDALDAVDPNHYPVPRPQARRARPLRLRRTRER